MTTLAIPVDNAVAVKGPKQGRWTIADWEQISADDAYYELIDGVLYMTTSPSSFHQWIISRLFKYIGFPAESANLAFAYTSPIGVLLPTGQAVQPDFVVIRTANAGIIYDRRIRGIPDLIIEVLSPGNATYDEDIKLKAYAEASIPEYAVIDPSARQLRLYTLPDQGEYATPRAFDADDHAVFACLPDIVLRVGDLFDGSPDTTL